jgi:arabinogalactan endo-1,4-beta-galactosidase
LSYYPLWHGQSLAVLSTTINQLSQAYNKKVLIAETSYPFTLGWNDWTNNLMGLSNQLIPAYPASNLGQKNYLTAIRVLLESSTNGIGFSYWGSEWVAFRGTQATNGSPVENQALWDFNLNALPVMAVFN